jgi:hypothetical protein
LEELLKKDNDENDNLIKNIYTKYLQSSSDNFISLLDNTLIESIKEVIEYNDVKKFVESKLAIKIKEELFSLLHNKFNQYLQSDYGNKFIEKITDQYIDQETKIKEIYDIETKFDLLKNNLSHYINIESIHTHKNKEMLNSGELLINNEIEEDFKFLLLQNFISYSKTRKVTEIINCLIEINKVELVMKNLVALKNTLNQSYEIENSEKKDDITNCKLAYHDMLSSELKSFKQVINDMNDNFISNNCKFTINIEDELREKVKLLLDKINDVYKKKQS